MLGLARTPIWSGSLSSLSKFGQTWLKLAGPSAQCRSLYVALELVFMKHLVQKCKFAALQ